MAPRGLYAALLLSACLSGRVCVRGDDYSSFNEEDFARENLDEEVEFPGGVTPEGKPKRQADVRRDPFVVKVFDHGNMAWKDADCEADHAAEVHRQLSSAWERSVALDFEEAARPGHHTAKRVTAGNLAE